MIEYLITSERPGETRTLIADYSGRVQGLAFASNNRGYAECSGFVPMGIGEAFRLYGAIGGLRVQISDTSSGAVYDGRVEDIAIDGDGVTITALGYSRALSDAPYTALWSTTKISEWRPLYEVGLRVPELYQMDTNNRVQIALTKGTTYRASNDVGAMVYQAPAGGSRQIIGVSFDLLVTLPANWLLQLLAWQSGFASAVAIYSYTGSAATTIDSQCITSSGCDYLELLIFNNTGAPYTYTGETGVYGAIVTNIRIVTATANMVSTTTTAAFSFVTGTPVTIAVVSTARMYAGLRVYLPVSGYAATVVSITDATHFVALFTRANAGPFAIGTAVQALIVYADEIADHLITSTAALNPGQLSTSLALTQTPGLDLLNEVYHDQLPASVMDYLVSLGDTAGNLWEWGVRGDQRLYLRPQNGQRTWYIDASDLDIQRTLDQLTNSIYAVYSDASDRTLRATPTSDAGSIARYGLTRRAALSVNTTSAAQAAYQQAVALADGKEPRPRAGVVVSQVFDANGSRWPLWYVAAGDTVVIRNLSPSLGTAIDRVRVFRLTRAAYSFANDTLTLEPETPIARLDVVLAQLAAGVLGQIGAPARGASLTRQTRS